MRDCNTGDFACFGSDQVLEVALTALVLVFVGLGIELSLDTLRRLWTKLKFPSEFLSVMYQELTVLGTFSFVLFISTRRHLWDFGEDFTQIVEFLHMVLFLSALCYVISVALVLVRHIVWKRQLNMLEERGVPPSGMFLVGYLLITRATISWDNFHLLRVGFLKQHAKLLRLSGDVFDITSPSSFSFARYLNVCVMENLTEMAELPFYLWLCLLPLITTVFIFSFTLEGDNLSKAAIYSYVVLAGLSVIVAAAVALKAYLILSAVASKYNLYYKGISLVPGSSASSSNFRYSMEHALVTDEETRTMEEACDSTRDEMEYRVLQDSTSSRMSTHSQGMTSNTKRRFDKKRAGGLKSCFLPRDYYSLFWLRSPALFKSLMQLLILLQAVGVALYITAEGSIYQKTGVTGFVVIGVTTFCVLVFVVGIAVPAYSIATAVGPMSKLNVLVELSEEDVAVESSSTNR